MSQVGNPEKVIEIIPVNVPIPEKEPAPVKAPEEVPEPVKVEK